MITLRPLDSTYYNSAVRTMCTSVDSSHCRRWAQLAGLQGFQDEANSVPWRQKFRSYAYADMLVHGVLHRSCTCHVQVYWTAGLPHGACGACAQVRIANCKSCVHCANVSAGTRDRKVTIMGPAECVQIAQVLITNKLNQASGPPPS